MGYTFSPYNLQQLTVAKYLFRIRAKTRIDLPPKPFILLPPLDKGKSYQP